MTSLEKLITIYARNKTVEDAALDSDLVNLCKANSGDEAFDRQLALVRDIKRSLQAQAGIQPLKQKQIKYALKLFHRLVVADEQLGEICRQLIRQSYYQNWSPKQQQYFDETSTRIAYKLDYFLSFTQRNRVGLGNPINAYHRYLIQSMGLPDPLNLTTNELASMVHRLLEQNRFRGFFFPTHEDDSQEVTDKVNENLEKCLVFIQLLQNEMFDNFYVNIRNFCHEEYVGAVNQQKGMIFLFADGKHPDEFIDEADVLFDLDEWYRYARDVDAVDIFRTSFATDDGNLPLAHAKLKEKVVAKVREIREALWEGAPGDLEK